jgi:hypothetical protein
MAITAAMTLQKLTQYGVDATFTTYASKDYDPATGKTSYGAPTEHTHKVVEEGRKQMLSGDAEMMIYVSPSGMSFTPEAEGTVTYKGRTWTIIDVRPIVFKGSVVLYELPVKGRTG